MEFFSDLKEIWNSFYLTIIPEEKKLSKEFWKINKDDLFCYSFMLLSTLTIWIFATRFKDKNAIIKYWDGPNYIFAAITMYRVNETYDPWVKFYHYPRYYFACHLPGYPIVIRLCSYLCFNNYYLGSYLSILFCSFLLVYSFRRFLIVYNCVKNPLFSTILISLIPTRLSIYHSVCASEPLYIGFACLALTFYKIKKYPHMMLCVWACCITRIEGMAVGATIGACFLLQFDILHALMMFLTFAADFGVAFMHKQVYGMWDAYLKFNQERQGIIAWPPMQKVYFFSQQEDHVDTYSFVSYYIVLIISLLVTVPKNGPASIIGFIHSLYILVLFHIDIYRYSLPCSIFTFIIGFDNLFNSQSGNIAVYMIFLLLLVLIGVYGGGQIRTNQCGDYFLSLVMNLTTFDFREHNVNNATKS